MLRALELFSGTGSVGDVLEQNNFTVTSLDNRPKCKPDILTDIMTWDYTQYPKRHFHYIHISPPCTEYSRALTTRPRRLEDGDRLAQRGLEILAYLEPRYFTIENPDYLLKTRDFMQPFQDCLHAITYCKYGYKLKKTTSIWTNIPWTPKPICNKANPCEHLAGKTMHPVNAQKIQSLDATRSI